LVRRALFITGAGISADSGLPTYRGVGGLYNRETTEEGLRIEEIVSGDMLVRQPEITWKYLRQIEQCCRGAQPNAAHRAIAHLDDCLERVMVFTQNVDGLHRAAGSREVIEVHGDLQALQCMHCRHEEASTDFAERGMPPHCPVCNGILRPKIVLFGEALPEGALECLNDAWQEGFDIVFSIGTSSVFSYIAQPIVDAAGRGIPTVEINPLRTPLSDRVDFYLPLRAAEAMTAVLARAKIHSPASRLGISGRAFATLFGSSAKVLWKSITSARVD
jgi:NAD-dependent deacetylase